MDCPHSTPDAWQEGRNPNCPILRAGDAWKARRFRGKSDWPSRQQRLWRASLGSLPPSLTSGVSHAWLCGQPNNRSDTAFKMRCCTREPDRCGNDGYYEVHKQVCIDSRRSRLLWGSGNTRRNRMDIERWAGAGFPNRDGTNVGVLENRTIGRWEPSKSPTASTGRDVRCAMPLSWMRGNMGRNHAGSGDGSVSFSTVGRLGTGFAANPQMRVDCGGPVSVRGGRGPFCGDRLRRQRDR